MDSKRSCCSPVTCCGMPIEKGCYLFAVVNAVFCALSVLGSLGFLGLTITWWFDGEHRSENDMLLVWLFTGIAAGSVVSSAIAMVFAVLLCVGVSQKKPRYIMAYLVYGIIIVTMNVLGAVALVCLQWQLMAYALIPLVGCVVHCLFLLMVYQTHAVLSEQSAINQHRRLLNNC